MTDEVVLVTGGSGYIAAYLIKLLQEEGYQVRTTIRDAKNEAKVKHLNELCPEAKHKVEVFEADLNNAEPWLSAVSGCKYVCHVASPFPLSAPKSEDELIKPAVEGTLNVLKACQAAKTVKRVVVTSSYAAIRGNVPYDRKEPISEKDWLDGEDRQYAVYNRSKALAEKAAWKFVEELPEGEKFELAVVNPTFVMGPVYNGNPGSSVELLLKIMKREYPMLPKLNFPCCDVRDVALAHLRCMTLPQAVGNRHMIVTSGVWLKGMADILDKEFTPQGYKIPTMEMPNAVAAFVSLFNSQLRQARSFAQEVNNDNSRMTVELGITPTPIDVSIVDMAYSMIEKGFVPKTDKYKGPPTTTTTATTTNTQ